MSNLYTARVASYLDLTDVGPVPTAFQGMFGRPGSESMFITDADAIEIDIMKGNRKTSKLIPRKTVGRLVGPDQKNLDKGNFTNVSRSFPLSIESSDIAASEMLKRIPGEPTQDSGLTKMFRKRYWATKQHYEQIRRQVRMFERLAAQSILEGKQDAILGTSNADEQYDFYRSAGNFITLGVQWTNVGASTPIGDLDDAAAQVEINGSRITDGVCMGADALEAFLKSTETKDYADNRRYELIQISSKNPVPSNLAHMVTNGWTAWGYVKTYSGRTLWIFTNNSIYENDAGSNVKLMPVGKVFVFSSAARQDRFFGPSGTFDDTPDRVRFYRDHFGISPTRVKMPANVKGSLIDRRMFYFDAYANMDFTVITTRTQSAPIFANTESDSICVITNAA